MIDTDGQDIYHTTSKGFVTGSLPDFREKISDDPVIFSEKRLSDNPAQGEAGLDDNRFFIGFWLSVMLSLELLGFVAWWIA